jgi:hypothetical protein
MTLPETKVFEEDMIGAHGAEQQLLAFRAVWDKGETYLRAIRQAAIGCSGLCTEDAVKAEVEALSLIVGDVVQWFEQCNRELLALQLMAKETAEKTLH